MSGSRVPTDCFTTKSESCVGSSCGDLRGRNEDEFTPGKPMGSKLSASARTPTFDVFLGSTLFEVSAFSFVLCALCMFTLLVHWYGSVFIMVPRRVQLVSLSFFIAVCWFYCVFICYFVILMPDYPTILFLYVDVEFVLIRYSLW
jgi:hypothetical protein